MEKINTLRSFINEGFKIVRDGKIIVLTGEEMRNFRYLDKAYDGRTTLECAIGFDEENKFAEKYLDDEEVCFELADKYYDAIADGDMEMEIANAFLCDLEEEEANRYESQDHLSE